MCKETVSTTGWQGHEEELGEFLTQLQAFQIIPTGLHVDAERHVPNASQCGFTTLYLQQSHKLEGGLGMAVHGLMRLGYV